MAERVVSVRLRAQTDEYRRAMTQASTATDGLTRTDRWQNLGRSASQLGSTLTRRVTLPLLALGVAAVKMSTDFDNELVKMQSLVGVTSDEVDGMRDSILDLAGETGRAPKELAEAMFFIQSAGIGGAEALDVLEMSAKAAAVGLGDTATVADLVTSAMNAYGTDVLSAEKATNDLTAAVRLGKLEPDQLAGAMGRVLPIASAMGVEFHEVSAAMAAMSKTGTNAAEGATQLRGILSTLLSPTDKTREALDSVDLSVGQLQQSLREDGLLPTLELLVESFDGNASATEAVFGNIRALSGVMDMLGGNVDETRAIFDEMQDTTGELDNAFSTWAESMGAKNARAFGQFQVAMIRLGDTLVPIAAQVLDFATSMFDAFSKLPDPVMHAAVAAGIFALALGPLFKIGGNVILAVTGRYGLIWAFKSVRDAVLGASITMRGAAVAMGGLALAAGVAAFAWQQHNARQAEAKARQEALTEALIETNGALQGQALQLLTNETLGRDAQGMLADLGVELKDLVDALEGGDDAWEDFIDSTLEAAQASGMGAAELILLEDHLNKVRDEFIAAGGKAEDFAEFVGEAGTEALSAGDGMDELEGDLESLGDEFEETTSAIEAYLDALRASIDPLFAAIDAADGLTDAQTDLEAANQEVEDATKDLTEAQRKHSDNSDEVKEAQERLEAALDDVESSERDLIDANFDHVFAMLQLKDALDKGEVSLKDAKTAIDDFERSGTITADQARMWKRELDNVADSADDVAEPRAMTITPPNIDSVMARLGQIERKADEAARPRNLRINVTEHGGTRTMGRQHGGPVRANRVYMVGEKGPELFVSTTAGRIIPNHRMATHARSMTSRPAPTAHRPHSGGGDTSVMVRLSASDRLGRALMDALRHEIRIDGGGNVQRALGQRS